MTDQIPAVTDDDRRLARKWAESIESTTNSAESTTNPWSDRAIAAARVILDTVPTPPPPTLADMTEEERAACQWMQADTNGGRDVISNPCYDKGRATILLRDGTSIPVGMEKITPRPDLPRMEWPRDTGIPGVAVGVPVADPDLIHRISDEAPPGTIVVEANLSATVRNGRYWHSAEEGHLTLAEALFYAPHEWDATAPITVVRWGE